MCAVTHPASSEAETPPCATTSATTSLTATTSQLSVRFAYPSDFSRGTEPGTPRDIWPTDTAPVIRRLENGPNEFAELRWGFPPARPKAPPVINFRSEGWRFPVGRCLVPASHFFEFTGTKSPKTK